MNLVNTEEIKRLLALGANPNDLLHAVDKAITAAIEQHGDWELWGDGRWRLNTVCSICGSSVPGICGHQHDPERQVVLRRDYTGKPGSYLAARGCVPRPEGSELPEEVIRRLRGG